MTAEEAATVRARRAMARARIAGYDSLARGDVLVSNPSLLLLRVSGIMNE